VTFQRCGVIDPVSFAEYAAHGGYKGLDRAFQIGPEATVAEIAASGLRGRGGAGFPTGIKWKTVADCPAGKKYVVVNADEGDSGTFADRMIMEGDPFSLIEGMTICAFAIGSDKGYVYLRSEYPIVAEIFNEALVAARAAGVLGKNVRGPIFRLISSCASAPAPMSAARRPRCLKALRASAGSCAPSHRCRRMRVCSASQPW